MFKDPDDDELAYKMELLNVTTNKTSLLPNWFQFDFSQMTLKIFSNSLADEGNHLFRITAKDEFDGEGYQNFNIVLYMT